MATISKSNVGDPIINSPNCPEELKRKTQETTTLVTANIDGQTSAYEAYNLTLQNAPVVIRQFEKSTAANTYQQAYSPNMSIRDGFDNWDMDSFRLSDMVPIDPKGMIAACLAAYKFSGNGILKNIVDLMADLVVQGIDVVHKKKKNEKFAKAWFNNIVHGPDFSERFANLLIRCGNNIVKRDTQKIPLSRVRRLYKGLSKNGTPVEASTEKEFLQKLKAADGTGQSDVGGVYDTAVSPYLNAPPIEDIIVEKRQIPTRYVLLNPLMIDVLSPELSMFVDSGDLMFGITLPVNVISAILSPKNGTEQVLLKNIPGDIVKAVRNGQRQVPLNKDSIDAYYYKKDSWEIWAQPPTYTVLRDVNTLKKMKLADLSCLDGIMAQIRLWKIGDKEKGHYPKQEAMDRLANMLMQNVPGGIIDIIWGPDIEMTETASTAYNFLGQSKYIPTLTAIYEGLGVPPIFTGATDKSGATQNFLAIQAFIVRLEYVRDRLREFWNKEFGIIRKALEWEDPPQLVFDRMNLNDQGSFLQILLHMVDRGILSDEALISMVGEMPEIEKVRIQRETKDREKEKRPKKAGPFYKPDYEHSWIEKFIMAGELTPSQVGIELAPKAKGEKTPNESKVALGIEGGMPNDLGGRPAGKKDSTKRKPKTFKPQRAASSLISSTIWAYDTQEKISKYITPIYLQMVAKKDLRSLTVEEFESLETLKFGVLVNCPLNSETNEAKFGELLQSGQVSINDTILSLSTECIKKHTEQTKEKPSLDIVRRLQCLSYAALNYIDQDKFLDETEELV